MTTNVNLMVLSLEREKPLALCRRGTESLLSQLSQRLNNTSTSTRRKGRYKVHVPRCQSVIVTKEKK